MKKKRYRYIKKKHTIPLKVDVPVHRIERCNYRDPITQTHWPHGLREYCLYNHEVYNGGWIVCNPILNVKCYLGIGEVNHTVHALL